MAKCIGRVRPGLAALFFLIFIGCGGDDDPADPGGGGGGDTTAPAAVADLHVGSVAGTTVNLSWTAPGDDGDTGTAAQFDLRWSGAPITDATWEACTAATGEPAPLAAGSVQVTTVDVGATGTFHFALKSADEVPNWSALSNTVSAAVTGGGFLIHQLTTEGNNIHPCLDDGVVAWISNNTVSGQDLFIANIRGASPTPGRLTDNGGEKAHPNNHGSERIVWEQRDDPGGDWEIWLYNKYTIPRYQAFTDNDVHDHYPDLDEAGSFAWLQGNTMFEEVHYWHESLHNESVISEGCCPTSQWSNNIPSADGGEVVWRSHHRSDGTIRTTLWDGGITDMSTELEAHVTYNYSIQGGGIAFEHHVTSPPTIRYWNGTTTTDVATGYNPSLYGSTVAFERWDGQDWEIWYWDGNTAHRITDNDFDDMGPSLFGTLIAWAGRTSVSGNNIFWVDVD